ncbi:MAG: hypothetical protein CMG08_06375 [Candidatus Marinimicrobia bacterium]|nr:hypothetical protein [Candidatus Neomarinimicrobiota bacterium]
MKNIMQPKIWLIILAVVHTFLGVIGAYIQMGGGTEHLAIVLYLLMISIYLLYAAFMTEGQAQARLAAVLCGPGVIWFIIGAVMKLDMLGMPVAEFPSALLPLTLWTLPTVTGIMNWNSDQ